MRRFIQVVLGINLAIVALVDVIGLALHIGPDGRLAAAEPIATREFAAVALGYAVVILAFVLPRFRRDPAWLLVPAIFLAALWLQAVYELAAGTRLVSESLPPTVLRALFVICYVSGYFVLSRRLQDRSAVVPGQRSAVASS